MDQSDVGGDDERKAEGNDEPIDDERPTTDEAPDLALTDDPTGDDVSPPVPPPPLPHEVVRRPKTLKAPRHPTQAEIDEHVLTHLRYASGVNAVWLEDDTMRRTSEAMDNRGR